MEFNEKLQSLRKQKNMTQEELAKALFVSRTAISKWESGRGYPNIDSLKAIAEFFGVTVDELLSGEQIISIAKKDGIDKADRFRDLIFGLLDTGYALFFFLPFFGENINGTLVPIFVCLGFGALGLRQLIKRKSVVKVDFDIIALGVFYAVVIAVFIFFEVFVVNYRPVLIEGVLEASYPSSTTLLVTCVIPSAAIQFKKRIKNNTLKKLVITLCVAFTVFMVVGRLISGVHWITDIIGGALFSAGIVEMYLSFINLSKR